MLSADILSWSRHLSGSGAWYRTDPRARLFSSVLLSSLAVSCASAGEFLLIYGLIGLLYGCSGAGWSTARSGLRPFLTLIALTFLLQILFTGSPLSAEGFRLALLILARMTALILVSANLVATTSPLDLSRSLGWAISPGRRLGLPVAEAVLILNLGIQFFPLLLEEGRSHRLALESRGISIRHHRPQMRLRALAAWALAVLTSSMERSQRLALALETKSPGAGRLRLRFPPWRRESTWLLSLSTAATVLWAFLRTA